MSIMSDLIGRGGIPEGFKVEVFDGRVIMTPQSPERDWTVSDVKRPAGRLHSGHRGAREDRHQYVPDAGCRRAKTSGSPEARQSVTLHRLPRIRRCSSRERPAFSVGLADLTLHYVTDEESAEMRRRMREAAVAHRAAPADAEASC